MGKSEDIKKSLLIVDVDDFEERCGLNFELFCFLNPLGELVSVLLECKFAEMNQTVVCGFGVCCGPDISIFIEVD